MNLGDGSSAADAAQRRPSVPRRHNAPRAGRTTRAMLATRLATPCANTRARITSSTHHRAPLTRKFARKVVVPLRAAETSGQTEEESTSFKPADEINLDGMRKETQRRIERALKKVGKATTKLRVARETVEALMAKEDASEAELAVCPDVDAIANDLASCKAELDDLNALSDVLRGCKSVNSPMFVDDAYERAKALRVDDAPPARPPRVPKVKGPRSDKPRMPYWTFVSVDGIDIRVGRTSSDNDSVSCDPQCRDSRDWWMHAAGCPGSHVVIRYTGDDLPKETMIDAAVLAAANSKANQVGRAPVSLVRCRQVSKPRGAKPGLVQLSGDVRTVTVNVKDEAARLERLMTTKS